MSGSLPYYLSSRLCSARPEPKTAWAFLWCKLHPGSPRWDVSLMLTNRPGRLGILMEDLPWKDIQPVTSLVIRASLPEMTRVLLGAHVAFYVQGVQRLDTPWSKSVQLDATLAYSTLPSSSCPYLPAPFLGWSSTRHSMAHPSRAASCPPKALHILWAGHERIGLAHVITGHGRAETS